jgi:hypothetical protein
MIQLKEDMGAARENLSLFAFEMEVEPKWNAGTTDTAMPDRARVATRGREIWSSEGHTATPTSRSRFHDNDSPFCVAMTTGDLELWLNHESKSRPERKGSSIHDASNRLLSLRFSHST